MSERHVSMDLDLFGQYFYHWGGWWFDHVLPSARKQRSKLLLRERVKP